MSPGPRRHAAMTGFPALRSRPVTVSAAGGLRVSVPRASSNAAAPGGSLAERPLTRRPPRVPAATAAGPARRRNQPRDKPASCALRGTGRVAGNAAPASD